MLKWCKWSETWTLIYLLTYPPALFPVPHHSCWEFCAADPAGFYWAVPSGPPSCPAPGGAAARRLRTTGVRASLLSSLRNCPPAPCAPQRPARPLRRRRRHHPRLPPLPVPLFWAWLREVQDHPEPCPCRPPPLCRLQPRVGSRHHGRRKSRRPRSLQLLWVARSSRQNGPRSSCSCQERSEAAKMPQSHPGQTVFANTFHGFV